MAMLNNQMVINREYRILKDARDFLMTGVQGWLWLSVDVDKLDYQWYIGRISLERIYNYNSA